MEIKYSLILGFLGLLHDRFVNYGEERDLEQKFELASRVEGLKGLELVYPYDFKDVAFTQGLLKKYKLDISAVNVNIKTDKIFHYGSLTNSDAGIRKEAVQYLQNGMDLAAQLGCNLVTCCPLGDGFDYPFELNYTHAWKWLVDGFGEAASYRKDVRVSMEYKPSESRTHCILPGAGVALAACLQINAENIGVTLDMGHAFYGGESPAQSAAMLASANKLFVVHVNDNYRNWDWDMIVGSVNPWDLVETLLYLDKVGYHGWLTADVSPNRLEPVATFSSAYQGLMWAQNIIARVGKTKLWQYIDEGNPIAALNAVRGN